MLRRLKLESASALNDVILRACRLLSDSFKITWDTLPYEEQAAYCSALNGICAKIIQTILRPLYAQFPQLDILNLMFEQSFTDAEFKPADSPHCELPSAAALSECGISDQEVSTTLIRALSEVVADLEAAKLIIFEVQFDDKLYSDSDGCPIEAVIAALHANLLTPLVV